MSDLLDVTVALGKAIELLNQLDNKRARQLDELQEQVRALSNRIEAVTRRLPPLDARGSIPQDWQRRGLLAAHKPDNDEHSHGL